MADQTSQVIIEISTTSKEDKKEIKNELRATVDELNKDVGLNVDLRDGNVEALDPITIYMAVMLAIITVDKGLDAITQIKKLAGKLAVLLEHDEGRSAKISLPGHSEKVDIDGSMSEDKIAKRLSDVIARKN